MIPVSTLYDEYIDRRKLTEQKNPFEYIVPPPSRGVGTIKTFLNDNKWSIARSKIFINASFSSAKNLKRCLFQAPLSNQLLKFQHCLNKGVTSNYYVSRLCIKCSECKSVMHQSSFESYCNYNSLAVFGMQAHQPVDMRNYIHGRLEQYNTENGQQ